MKTIISNLKSRNSLELSRKEREKERELEEVHQRVIEALTRNEDNYSQHTSIIIANKLCSDKLTCAYSKLIIIVHTVHVALLITFSLCYIGCFEVC